MQSTLQSTVTDAMRLVSTTQEAVANPLGFGLKIFRHLDKDTRALLIGLLSLVGLAYAIQHFSSRR